VRQFPDFTPVADIIGRFARDAAAIISDNPNRTARGDSWGDWMDMTYSADYYMHQAGHLDDLEFEITQEVVSRAKNIFSRTPANSKGLALLDILLKDAAKTIRPLLARQSAMVLQ